MYGLTSTKSTEDKNEMQNTLSNSATFGVEFDHETINTSYSVDLMNDIKTST